MVTKSMEIPAWLKGRLVADDLGRIAAAVKQIEVTTNGEVVPMIVRRSTYIGHVFPLLVLAVLCVYTALGGDSLLAPWRPAANPLIWGALDLSVLTLAAWFLSRIPLLQRFLTSSADLESQVLRRAEIEFFEAGLAKTENATGILLFLSFAERRSVVLADKTIAAKLPPETWGNVVKIIIDGAKSQRLADGLIEAIDACGRLVAPHFPPRSDDRNEIKDALLIKD